MDEQSEELLDVFIAWLEAEEEAARVRADNIKAILRIVSNAPSTTE